jgi:hypothetical protein
MTDLRPLDAPGLIRETLATPELAAHRLMDMHIPRPALWLGLGLMSVLNVILYALTGLVYPPRDPNIQAFYAPIMHTPLIFTGFMFVTLALVVKFISTIGISMGGKARLEDILVLVTWLQALRLMVGLFTFVFTAISPGLASLLALIAGLWGIYIHIVFVDEAHGFHNRVKAAVLTVLVYVGVMAGLVFSLEVLLFLILGAP